MATYASLPYGMTDLYVEKLDASDTPIAASGVRLLNGQTVEFTPNEDQTDEEGYGSVVGTVYSALSADVSLQSAGVDLDAQAAVTGGTVASSGSTPNVVQTLDVGVEGQARPYVKITGRALGNNGGSMTISLNKVRFSIPGGGLDHKAFVPSTQEGRAIVPSAGPNAGKLVTRKHYETATAYTPA